MKFAKHLEKNKIPEWHKQYLIYKDLKKILNIAAQKLSSQETCDLECKFEGVSSNFFSACDSELAKIETFFFVKLKEAQDTRKELVSSLQSFKKSHNRSVVVHKHLRGVSNPNINYRGEQDLLDAFTELYLSLIYLKSYQVLNITGFRKILKKHDKLLSTTAGAEWKELFVDSSFFSKSKDSDKLLTEIAGILRADFGVADSNKAVRKLRTPSYESVSTEEVAKTSAVFVVSLLFAVIATTLSSFGSDGVDITEAVSLSRGPFLVILFVYLTAVNMFGWRKFLVNYVLIFEIKPDEHVSETYLILLASKLSLFWACCVILLSYLRLSVALFVIVSFLAILMIMSLVRVPKSSTSSPWTWFIKTLVRVLIAPFAHVRFPDFWLGDQLNSLAQVLIDFKYIFCFCTSSGTKEDSCLNPTNVFHFIVLCLPAYFRFAQCLRRYRDTGDKFPHIANSFKYATTFLVVISGYIKLKYSNTRTPLLQNPFLYLYIVFRFLNTGAVLLWDIKMDWGFFEKGNTESWILRSELLYPPSWYYSAFFLDILLRFSWIWQVVLLELKIVSPVLIISILSPIEVLRRFMWNFFRLENEHLNNCGQFRAVRNIRMKPILHPSVIDNFEREVPVEGLNSCVPDVNSLSKTSSCLGTESRPPQATGGDIVPTHCQSSVENVLEKPCAQSFVDERTPLLR